MESRLRRLVGALVVAVALAVALPVVLHAADGPYNTNPTFCAHADLTDAYELFRWFYHECWLPNPPSIPD